MGRPSKLSPETWDEIERRIGEGEGVRDLAQEFGVSPAAISRKGFVKQSKRVQEVAQQVAKAKDALETLPIPHQRLALNLADKLRSISDSLASAAELGAKTAHRLQALANSEVGKVDDADPLASVDKLRNVGILTKLANDSAATGLNLLSANKEAVRETINPKPDDDDPVPLRPQISRDEWLKTHGLG